MTEGTRSHYEVIVIGAGVAGIYQIKRLVDLGIDARCWTPPPTSAAPGTGTAIRARASTPRATPTVIPSRGSCSTSGTGRNGSRASPRICATSITSPTSSICANTCSSTARSRRRRFDEAEHLWRLKLDDGRELTCRFVILAVGLLSTPTLPRLEGMDSFKGRSFHTFHWPHEPVELAGKKVAIIGTGATAIQVIGEIADKVGELTVFQRRPNWSAPLNNGPISDAEMADIRARYDEIFATCARTPGGFEHEPDRRGFYEVTREERLALWDKLYDEPGFGIWLSNFREIFTDEAANAEFSAYIAERIRRRVEGSRHRREADPARPRLRRAAGAAGDQLLRGLQPRQRPSRRHQRDADRAGHRERACGPPRATTSSTSSSTPPASTRSPARSTGSTSPASAARSCATSGATARRPSSA